LTALGHDVKQVPPAYSKPFRQGHKNDFRDAYAVAEAVQRPATRCVPVKTDHQLDLQAKRCRQKRGSPRRDHLRELLGSPRLGTSANPTILALAISPPDHVQFVAAVRHQRDLIPPESCGETANICAMNELMQCSKRRYPLIRLLIGGHIADRKFQVGVQRMAAKAESPT